MKPLFRIGLSLLAAVILVGVFSLFGIATYFEPPPINQVVAFEVAAATPQELAAARRNEQPEVEPAAPPQGPERNGFVQLEFEITPDGRAANVRVVGAVPPGYFEAAAVERIERQRYLPERVNGEPVMSVRTQIVEFKYRPGPAPSQAN